MAYRKLDHIDEKIVKQYNALPIFKRGKRLFVAMGDPTRLDAIDAIRFNTGMNVETVIVEEDRLLKLIEKILEGSSNKMMEGLDDDQIRHLHQAFFDALQIVATAGDLQ